MPRIARIQHGPRTMYALLEDNSYRPIDGDLFVTWKPSSKTISMDKANLLAPVLPPQIICIGANYRKHCNECNMPIPERPVIFFKLINTLAGPDDTVMIPKTAPNEVDWEAELVIVIGKRCKHVSEQQAGDYILGYTCGNDISARDCQLKIDKQWARGKSFDTFAPIGPWIATDIDGDNLDIKLTLNGRTMQHSNTSDMIFSCRNIVSYLSQSMTLLPGSIIMTGTPSGVGMGRTPQQYLRPGDQLCVEIEGIGTLNNTVAMES
ncbi:MAG: fumarylacetoacetate hydrolase family protein [Phycisphaeraceae bacterium]|nr:fumarylacetoacetate hydrolase family protein [Phycisphaeraceae bacterium]